MSADPLLDLAMTEMSLLLEAWEARCDYDDERERAAKRMLAEIRVKAAERAAKEGE